MCFTLLQAFLCCFSVPASLSTWDKTEGAMYHVSKFYLISCGFPETCILRTVHVLSANLSRVFIVMIQLVLSMDGEGIHCLSC